MIESLLLTATNILTYQNGRLLTSASGFFFERSSRLFLVTSLHVLKDVNNDHFPDRITIELHTNSENLAESTGFSIPLYEAGAGVWRQGSDRAGTIDVAVLELNRSGFPAGVIYRAFSSHNFLPAENAIELGASLLILGFPLGFHDTLHHLPVVRHAIVASSYGLRFQGDGFFLTDARTHRGLSGSAVVIRSGVLSENDPFFLPWILLGIHSSRFDMSSRDAEVDEPLGLNCAWYAEILTALTE